MSQMKITSITTSQQPQGRGGRKDEVTRWDCRMTHPMVHFLKGQWGMGQGPTKISQLLCELTFSPLQLFSAVPARPSTRHFLLEIWTILLENVYAQVDRSSVVNHCISNVRVSFIWCH